MGKTTYKVVQDFSHQQYYPWRIHGMGMFTKPFHPKLHVAFFHRNHVGKYSSPMDPSWVYIKKGNFRKCRWCRCVFLFRNKGRQAQNSIIFRHFSPDRSHGIFSRVESRLFGNWKEMYKKKHMKLSLVFSSTKMGRVGSLIYGRYIGGP